MDVSCSVLWMKSRISSWLFISILRLVVFCLRNIRPSDVQYVYSRPLYFSSASCFTSSVRYLVRFSVMKILSGWFFKPFLLLYTLLRVLYETNLTITWDFPSFTFPIICDLPMSCKLISSPSLSLHTLRISSSVLTGCLTFPLSSTGTTESRVPIGYVEVIISKVLWSPA